MQTHDQPTRHPRCFAPRGQVLLWAGLLVMGLNYHSVFSQETTFIKIDQIKVAYLLNFIRFTTWNSDPQQIATQPLKILIIGDETFSHYLEEAFPNNQLENRPVIIHQLPNLNDFDTYPDTQKQAIEESHVVYLRHGKLDDIFKLESLNSQTPFLLIGDLDHFAQRGGMIGFRESRSRITFEINAKAIRESSIQVSSKVMRLGIQVRNKD